MIIQVGEITFGYNSHPVLTDVNFALHAGEIVGIVGPNGSGKSTLLGVISRALLPASGSVWVFGTPIQRLPRRDLARLMSVVRQQENVAFDFTVREVVTMGRSPYVGRLGRESPSDLEVVNAAMRIAEVEHLAARRVSELSGGEFQRVILARTLAQDTPVILLDEPTGSLDLKYQVQTLGLLQQLAKEGRSIIITMHDLTLAAQYCDRLLLLHEGRIRAAGTPAQILTPPLLEEVYELATVVIKHPVTGLPVVLPSHDAFL
ncbi:MAG: heme ABC transporter ATP-binding protein [Limnochordia bacterium]